MSVVSENALKSLRGLILEKNEFVCPMDNDFLLKFLRAKSFDVDRAYTTLKKYAEMRKSMGPYNPKLVLPGLRCGMVGLLKNRDPQGRHIFFSDFGTWSTKELTSKEMVLTIILACEEIISSVEAQENGVVMVADIAKFTMAQYFSIGVKDLITLAGFLQGSFPFRVKSIHILNSPRLFGIVYQIIRPMLTTKLQGRFNFHGQNLDSFYADLPREILPKSIGGNLTNEEALDQDFATRLLDKDEYFKSTTDLFCTKRNLKN